jgi:hypothetical protein
MSSDSNLRIAWAQDQLESLKVPITVNNMITLLAWSYAEGGWFSNNAEYNPLDTTQQEPADHPINSVGVEAYISLATGVKAITTTLENGYYNSIMAGFKTSLSPAAMAILVGRSPWGTSGTLMSECVGRASEALIVAHWYPPTVKPLKKKVTTPVALPQLPKGILPIDALKETNLVPVKNSFQLKVAKANGWHLWYWEEAHFHPYLHPFKKPVSLFVNKNWHKKA